jgi:hypothetical protein
MHKGAHDMTLDEIKAALDDRVLTRVSSACGVSVRVLVNIRHGHVDKVSKRIHDKLAAYLEGK